MKKLLLISVLIPSFSLASVIGTGEYFYGPETSENMACSFAEENAREDALRKYVGELVEASLREECFNEECFTTKDTNNAVQGVIKKIENKEVVLSIEQGKRICSVTISAIVEKVKPDLFFHVKDDKGVYRQNSEVTFYGISNKIGKIIAFNLYNDQYKKIFEVPVRQINSEIKMPTLIAKLENGKHQSQEKMVFVFTDLDIKPKPVYNDFEMRKFLDSIPFSNRGVVNRLTQIVR